MVASGNFIISVEEAKALDLRAREKFGISTLVLMENAGSSVAREAIRILNGKKRVAIFCGKGNNGGDGFVAARHLIAQSIRPDIFLAGKISELRNEAKINLGILSRLKQKIIEINEKRFPLVKRRISSYSLIIDALFGVGLSKEIGGIFRKLIEAINDSKARVLSVDIPSGLDARTGKIGGCCIKANETITFVAKKYGMVTGDGPNVCGRIIVQDLGLPLLTLSNRSNKKRR